MHPNKTTRWHAKKLDENDAVAEVKRRHSNSVTSLKCARVNQLIPYIIIRKEKAPIYKFFLSKVPKTQQICHYRHARITSGLFLLYDKGVGFSSRKNFANLGSFAKAEAVECRICNSLIEATSKFEVVSSSMSHMKKDNSNILTINTCLLVFYS